MPLVITINPWYVVGFLLYIIVGLTIVAVHQHVAGGERLKFSTGEAFSWVFLWPAIAIIYVFANR